MMMLLQATVSSNEATWEEELGFIGATTDDVETGHMTLHQAKQRCASNSRCEAITHRKDSVDAEGKAHFYLKAGKQVSGSDRTWLSFLKRPAGAHSCITRLLISEWSAFRP